MVTIKADGTKTRKWTGIAQPEMPESIDLKITDRCDMNCAWCHESSTVDGSIARYHNVLDIIHQMPEGTEIAIGGGNPLSHTYLRGMLDFAKANKVIANITVNSMHLYKHADELRSLQQDSLIHGLGVSMADPTFSNEMERFNDGNMVLHYIAGVSSIWDTRSMIKEGFKKLLVLGYKSHGRGASMADEIKPKLDYWRYHLGILLNAPKAIIAFDNLAIKQLSVDKHVGQEKFNELYMGDDGEFTFYIDAVTMTYAKDSTSPRKPIGTMTVKQMFDDVRSQRLTN